MQERLGGPRRGVGAEAAARDHAGIGECQPVAREKERVGLERRHQGAGDAEADEGTPGEQHGQACRSAEAGRPGGGHREERDLHAARSEAVEQEAERDLRPGEGQEVDRGEEAEIAGGEPELASEVRRDHRVDGAEEVGDDIAGGERHHHAPGRAERRKDKVHNFLGIVPRHPPWVPTTRGLHAQRFHFYSNALL